MVKSLQVEGVVRLFQSENADPPCICCGGEAHIFGITVDVPSRPSLYPGSTTSSVDGYLDEWLSQNKLALKGKRIRITVEVVETEATDVYHAERNDDGWMVLDQGGALLYGDDPLTEREAHDLAWAFNSGAEDDQDAIRLIYLRDGKRPQWLSDEYHISDGS